jgi:CHAT domain-containing protein
MTGYVRSSSWAKSVLLAVLWIAPCACRQETPQKPVGLAESGLPRVVQPRLSGFGVWHPCVEAPALPGSRVAQMVCAPPTVPNDLVSLDSDGCDRKMSTMTEAVRVLAYVPVCTDAAVAKLEAISESRRDAVVLSNLSAAYYVRAQRKDQLSDFVRALSSADAAVKVSPSPEAMFNRALAEEMLGLSLDATASWNAIRHGTDGWAKEATEQGRNLLRAQRIGAAVQWKLNAERLTEIAQRDDRKGVTALITDYRTAAQRHVENEVLPAWAAAETAHSANAAEAQLRLAEKIAVSLAELTRDHYLQDVVSRIRNADPATQAAFRRGLTEYAAGRTEEQQLQHDAVAAAAYARAEKAFAESGNPFRLMAIIKGAAQLTIGGHFAEAERALAVVERDARLARYPSFAGRVHAGRGFLAMMQGRLLDSIAEYTESENAFRAIGDRESESSIITRKIGVYRLIGNHELTWREIFKLRDYSAVIRDPQSLHLSLGELATAALDLGYPDVALRYQDAAVALWRTELRRQANDEKLVASLIANLGVALRARAAIYAHLGNDVAAQRDLDEAFDRIGKGAPQPNDAIRNGFQARLAEVEAQTLARKHRTGEAIAALSAGIDYAARTHFSSLMASLLVQRAEQQSIAGNTAAELDDLRAALSALRREEQAMLGTQRLRPNAELMWSAYFGRYQQTYRRLIQRLVERGEDAEAFDYTEKARAFEPLHLILGRDDVPPKFRALIRNGEPFRLDDVERLLPEGRFLLQYAVLEDRTFVWVIWNGGSQRTTLPIGNAQIARWTATLQRLGRASDYEDFDRALSDPYVALLREPLARVNKLHAGRGTPHVVIVPDRAMHGLPFAALRNGKRYVVRDFVVAVEASATLYAYSLAMDEQRRASDPKQVLIVADPAFDKNLDIAQRLGELGWARSEGKQIEALYHGALPVDTLTGEKATPAAFLRLASGSSVIHIAAHGIANPDIPSRSFILLARSGNDSGAVDAERLLTQMHLHDARLVVLATCSSAGGTPVGPEGLAPLVRPLIVSGAPGVIGTLWNVKDNADTTELLVRFHRHYRDGANADDALRLAQLEMLEGPELERSSAVAWAPFQAIGHASSPFQQHTRR